MSFTEDNFKKVLLGDPHAILGKNGITEEFIVHTSKLLKRYKIIKIKALKSAVHNSNMKDLTKRISEATASYLLDSRGKIFILSKKPRSK